MPLVFLIMILFSVIISSPNTPGVPEGCSFFRGVFHVLDTDACVRHCAFQIKNTSVTKWGQYIYTFNRFLTLGHYFFFSVLDIPPHCCWPNIFSPILWFISMKIALQNPWHLPLWSICLNPTHEKGYIITSCIEYISWNFIVFFLFFSNYYFYSNYFFSLNWQKMSKTEKNGLTA